MTLTSTVTTPVNAQPQPAGKPSNDKPSNGKPTNASVLAHKPGDVQKLAGLVAATIALWKFVPGSSLCYLPLVAFSGAVLVKPKTPAQHLANLLLAAVWSLHSMLFVKILSFGQLSGNFGCLLPYLSLAYLAHRGKNPTTSHCHSRFSRLVVQIMFDPPLVLGTLLAKPLGVHILHDSAGNFLTVVDEDIVMSSMPTSSDVPMMLDAKVGAVVNMQGEWSGPISAYAGADIKQLRLPTTDMECPTLADLETGVAWMEQQREKNPDKRILVHCKGGRGRATTMVLAFYVKKGMDPGEAFERLQKIRPVVEPIVLTYPALMDFHDKYQ